MNLASVNFGILEPITLHEIDEMVRCPNSTVHLELLEGRRLIYNSFLFFVKVEFITSCFAHCLHHWKEYFLSSLLLLSFLEKKIPAGVAKCRLVGACMLVDRLREQVRDTLLRYAENVEARTARCSYIELLSVFLW